MQALSFIGEGSTELVGEVAAQIDGQVATVEATPVSIPDGPTTYRLSHDGIWRAHGTDATLTDLLDRLAPRYEYALIADLSRPRLPTVVIEGSDSDPAGTVVRRVDRHSIEPSELATVADEVKPWITLETLVSEIKEAEGEERSGAIATFTGRVRAKDAPDDAPTTHLTFEKYDGVADRRLAELAGELETRDGVFAVRLHHRTGTIEAGEDIVFVVVLAGHRREAFRAVEDGIDRLKEEVPIFKKEVTVEGDFWVHDRP